MIDLNGKMTIDIKDKYEDDFLGLTEIAGLRRVSITYIIVIIINNYI